MPKKIYFCETCGNPTKATPQGMVICAGCIETLDDMDQLEIQEDERGH